MKCALLAIAALLTFGWAPAPGAANEAYDLIYGYECHRGLCRKVELSEQNFSKAVSLPVCRLFCGSAIGTLWPKPTGAIQLEQEMRQIDIATIKFLVPAVGKDNKLWKAAEDRWLGLLNVKIPNQDTLKAGGYKLTISVDTTDKSVPSRHLYDTDESYILNIQPDSAGDVWVNITAANFFGARHGLESLIQLIVYDDIRREIQITAKASIADAPVYKWRGVVLDTSRNFYSVKSIKRTLEGLAMVKMNTFHWHITDSHSFPLKISKRPELAKLGAYTPSKVYTHKDVQEVFEYGLVRGIRVMPEFDAPAHVGEGWQHKNMTACFNAQPWTQYCVEPPCGQLDPTVPEMYDVLEDIFSDMNTLFKPDVFHMGGDEVSTSCWNSSTTIRNWMKARGWGLNESDFMQLWGHFQTEALARWDRVTNNANTPIILWTSRLTDLPYIDMYLDPRRYIIQLWTKGDDKVITDTLKRGFRVILSNYDALYFDCGNAAWVTSGNNWCSPFIGWQKVYENRPTKIAGDYVDHMLGAEAAIWSEQIDEQTLDNRFWPRASALAERLWSDPIESWKMAESRLLLHRERLVENGIGAEAMQPEWCVQNENECPIDAYTAGSLRVWHVKDCRLLLLGFMLCGCNKIYLIPWE